MLLVRLGPFTNTINFNPSMDSNCIHYEVRDEVTYPFPNFKGVAADVWNKCVISCHAVLCLCFLIYAS